MVAHPLGKRAVLNRPCAFEPRLLRQSLDRWQSLLYCTRLESVRACGHRRLESYPIRQFGELAERSKAPVLKTGVPSGTGGSNPPTLLHVHVLSFRLCAGLHSIAGNICGTTNAYGSRGEEQNGSRARNVRSVDRLASLNSITLIRTPKFLTRSGRGLGKESKRKLKNVRCFAISTTWRKQNLICARWM